MDYHLLKAIGEFGVLVIISVIFLKQQQALFNQQEINFKTLAKLEMYLNNSYLRDKSLEVTLILKAKEIRWSIQNTIMNYIKNNNLKDNWILIPTEFKTYINVKMNNFETEMHDIIDEITYKNVQEIFNNEVEECFEDMMAILEDLKNNSDDKENYETARRIVKAHMQDIENKIIIKIKKLVG